MLTAKTRVLVVDDMSTMRAIVTKMCREIGLIDIVTAADGELAWEKLQTAEVPFELIISDWNMPNCSGLDLLKRVRSDERLKKTKFVMVTAETEKSQIVEAIKAGVDQYLMKPFTKEMFVGKLSSIYKKSKSA
jgi:two-component system, chemotaxis family, chemotaxis protein CheY